MRSHIASSSGSSDDAITMAAPSCASSADQSVDLRFGADVDTPGRFIEQKHPRLGEQAFGESDLLLIPARELVDVDAGARRLDAQLLDRALDGVVLFAWPDDIEAQEAVQRGKGQIVRYRKLQ